MLSDTLFQDSIIHVYNPQKTSGLDVVLSHWQINTGENRISTQLKIVSSSLDDIVFIT